MWIVITRCYGDFEGILGNHAYPDELSARAAIALDAQHNHDLDYEVLELSLDPPVSQPNQVDSLLAGQQADQADNQ
jgi:hypothetical protein